MKYLILSLLMLATLFRAGKAQKDVIFRALSDEMERNMKELAEKEDYTAPFFMEFALNDYEYDVMFASLGSIIRSASDKGRNKSIRVMVGDYNLSDENFNDNSSNQNHNDGNIALPLEDDYLAIRRSYWITTNNVFKMASESYRNKLSALKLKGLTEEDLPAADLSREEVVVEKLTSYKSNINRLKAAKEIKQMSKVFADYPAIHFSQVSFFHINSLRYMVNSEGTMVSTPFKFYVLHVAAIMPDEDQHNIWQQMIYYAENFDGLPKIERVENDIQRMADNLYAEARAEKFDEKYIGPVMFEDFAVVEENIIGLFNSGTESLIGNRPPLVNNKNHGLVIPSQQTWEHRMDKRVIDKKLSVYELTSLKGYKNKPLMGHFSIDNQGVKPADSLLLIKDGVLKAQIVSRTPTSVQDRSTGNYRTGLSDNNVISALAPGIVFVKSNETTPADLMKEKLMELGKEEGLEYVFCARPLKTSANNNSLNYYKIDVESGNETLVRGSRLNSDIDDLRDIAYVSDDVKVFNTLFNSGRLGYTRGVPVSFIAPGAIILKESQISGDANPIKGELPVVPSPLTIDKE